MLNDQRFVHDPAYRRDYLARMRERIKQGKINEQLRAEVLHRAHLAFPGKGLFCEELDQQ